MSKKSSPLKYDKFSVIPQYISIKEDEELSKEEKEKRRREKKEEEERLAAEKLLQEKLERQEKEEEEKEEDIFNFNIDTSTSINESNEDAAKKDFLFGDREAIQDNTTPPQIRPVSMDTELESLKREPMKVEDFYSDAKGTSNTEEWGDVVEETKREDGLRIADRYVPDFVKNLQIGGKSSSQNREEKEKERVNSEDYISDAKLLRKYIDDNYLVKTDYLKDEIGTNSISTYVQKNPGLDDLKKKFNDDISVGANRTVFPNLKDHDINKIFTEAVQTVDLHQRTNAALDDQNTKKKQLIENKEDIGDYLVKANNGKNNLIKDPNKRRLAQINTALDIETDTKKREQLEYLQEKTIEKINKSNTSWYINRAGEKVEIKKKPDFELWFNPVSNVASTSDDGGGDGGGAIDLSDPYQAYLAQYNNQPRSKLKKANDDLILEESGFLLEDKEVGDYYVGNTVLANLLSSKGYKSENGVFKAVPLGDLTALSHAMGRSKFWTRERFMSEGDIVPQDYEGKPYKDEQDFIDFVKRRREQWYDIKSRDAALEKMYRLNQDPKSFKNSNLGSNIVVGAKSLLLPLIKVGGVSEKGFQQHFNRTDRDIRMLARTIIDDEGLPMSDATKKATEQSFLEELGGGTFHLMGMLPYFKALGKTSSALGLTQFAMAPGMTRYVKQGRVFTQSMMAKQAAKTGMTVKQYARAGGWTATEASTLGKLKALAMVGILEDVQMQEGLEFLTGEGLGRGVGFGFATARKLMPFSFVDPKSKFYFGTKRNQLNTFLETTIKAPLSFKAGVEFGESTQALINDLYNREDVSTFLEERYGDVSAYGRMTMMDLITGGMLHGTHLKSMDFKRTQDIANLKNESQGLMIENYKKFAETGDSKYIQEAIKYNEIVTKTQERLDQINELDRYTNPSRANEAYKEELDPIVKQFENVGRKLKIVTTNKDIFNDAGDRVDALYIPKGAREKNGKKNEHSEIHVDIRNQKGKGIAAHEAMHAYFDLIFEGNVQLKERFRKNFETAIKRVVLTDGRKLYDAILQEKNISKFEKVEEMFSHTAEFLSKAEYYNQLVDGGAFREIKGVVGRFAEKHLGDKLKPDIETEQGLVDLLGRYVESVRKGDGGIKQLERLQNWIERGESTRKTMSTSELDSRVKEIENRKTKLLEDIGDLRIAKPEGYLDLIKRKTAEYNTQNKIGKDLVAEPLTDFYGERVTTKENVERSNINEKSIKKWKEAKEELDKMPDLPKGGRPISPKLEKLTNELRENNKGLLNLFVKDAYTPTMGSEITKAQVKAYTEGTYFNSILNAYTPKIGMPFGAYLKMRLFGKGYNLKNLTGRPLAQGNVFKGITAGRDIDITQRTQSLDVLREGGFDIAGGENVVFPIESTGPGGSPRVTPTPKSRLAINKVKAPSVKYEVEINGKKTELNWRDYIQNRIEVDYPNLNFETTKLRDMASYKNHSERARKSGVEEAIVVGKFGVKPETYAKMSAEGKDGKRTKTAMAWQLRGTKKDPGDIQAIRKVLENRKDLPGIIESVAEGTLDLFDTKTRENIAPEILKGKSAGIPKVLLHNPLLFKVAVEGTGTKGDIYEWSNRLKEYHTTKDLDVKEKFENDFLNSIKSPQELKAIIEQYTKLVYAQGVKQYLEKNPEKLEVSEVKRRIELTQAGKPRTAATANLERETKKILKEFEAEVRKQGKNRTESEGDIINRLIRKTPYRVENFHDVLESYKKEKEALMEATVEKQLQTIGEVKRIKATDKTYEKLEFFPGRYVGKEKSVNKRVVEIVDVKGLDKSKINIKDGLGPRITSEKTSADYIEFAKEDVSTIDPRILNNPKLAKLVTNQYGYGQYRPGINELTEHIKWLDKARTEGTVIGERREIMNVEQQKAFISEALITNAKNPSKTKIFDYKFEDGRSQLDAVKYNDNLVVMKKWHEYLNNPRYADYSRNPATREQMSREFRENEIAADGFTYAETKLANKNMLEYLSSNVANTYNTFAKKSGYGEEFSLNNMHLLYQMQTNLSSGPWRGLATHSAGTLLAQKPIFTPKGTIDYAKMYRSEHEFQAGNFTGNNVLNTIVNASNLKAFLGKYKPMAEQFGQTVIEKPRQKRIDDPKAGGTTGNILAKEQMGPYVPAKANIFQTRADLENTINWETGRTYAEEYQRDLGDFAVVKTLQNKLSNIIGTKASSNLSKSEALRVTAAIDKIIAQGRKKNQPKKGGSFWDLDDTLLRTKSGVRYTLPNPSGKPAPGRKVIFMAGGPGAGKSNVIKQLGLEKQGFKVVNQDISLQWLAKNHGLPTNMRDFTPEQASKWGSLGWDARMIAKRKQTKFQGRGDGIIVDGTGSSFRSMEAQRMEFLRKGYDVHMLFVETSKDVAIERNRARKERSLKTSIVERTWDNVMKNKDRFQKPDVFGKNFTLIKTDKLKQTDPIPADVVGKMDKFTKGYIKGRLDAGEYAHKGADIEARGGKFDFAEFDYIKEGTEGPLWNKAMGRAKKFGTKDTYILTARPHAAQTPIFRFLEARGLKIPFDNIITLENSTAEAKALKIIEKIGEGYNDIYFADDAMQNVKAVKNVLNQFDIKGKVQRAKATSNLDRDFNQIIEDVKGVAKEMEFKSVTATMMGAKKGRWKWVIPPSAADFELLTSYTFAGRGKKGEAHQKWWNDNLFKPFARGINDINSAKQSTTTDYMALRKLMPEAKKKLNKKVPGTKFTHDAAIRVHRWTESGFEVPGLSRKDLKILNEHVNNNPKLKAFSEQLGLISKQPEGWIPPTKYWLTENVTADLHNINGRVNRKKYLAEWIENKNIIFSEKNMNKIEAVYGKGHVDALKDMLYRMEHGTNRPVGRNKLTNQFMNWTNNSVGAIMFFNMRSAGLQLLSSANYINHAENNVFRAAKVFANQKQYWKDFSTIFNSDMLKQRRAGLKMNVNEAEIAASVEGSSNKVSAALSYLLKKGFLPTQAADSFAIASGGATFYRNRIKMYEKQGISAKKAREKAWTDFQEIAEKTQQSARPDLISQQQASPLGRLILAFANTPMQYARIMKKSAMDLASGRGSTKSHVSRILYYGAIQSMIFASLQSGMFSMLFNDDMEEDYVDKKTERVANTMIDSLLRGIGVAGASVSAIKNGIIRFMNEGEKKYNQDYMNAVVDMLNVSPPIGSKVRKLKSAGDTYKWNKDVMGEMGMDIENPALYAVGNVISATTNVPLDRLVTKINNVKGALDSQNEIWQRIALFMGYNRWDLGMDRPAAVQEVKDKIKKEKKKKAKKKAKFVQEVKEEEKVIKQQEKINEQVENEKELQDRGLLVDPKCSHVSSKGRCKISVAKAGDKCTVHEKVEQNETGKKTQCKKVKSNGKRCGMKTSSKSGYCYYHD